MIETMSALTHGLAYFGAVVIGLIVLAPAIAFKYFTAWADPRT